MGKVLVQSKTAVASLRNSLTPFLGDVFLTKEIPISKDEAPDCSIPNQLLLGSSLPYKVYQISFCESRINSSCNRDRFERNFKKALGQNKVVAVRTVNGANIVKLFSTEPNAIIETVKTMVSLNKT